MGFLNLAWMSLDVVSMFFGWISAVVRKIGWDRFAHGHPDAAPGHRRKLPFSLVLRNGLTALALFAARLRING